MSYFKPVLKDEQLIDHLELYREITDRSLDDVVRRVLNNYLSLREELTLLAELTKKHRSE